MHYGMPIVKLLNKTFVIMTMLMTLYVCLTGCSTEKKDVYKGMTAEQIYQKGKDNVQNKRYEAAISDFEALEARYPYGEYAHKGSLAMIYAYYKANESANGLALADRFIKMNPRHESVDYAYYMRALLNYQANLSFIYEHFPINRSYRDPSEAKSAFEDFKVVVERFPESKYANDSLQRMIFLRNQLAIHSLHIVEYYMERKAFVAAANRANYTIKNFDGSPAIPKVLKLLEVSYRKLGKNDLAEDTKRVLDSNYPNA